MRGFKVDGKTDQAVALMKQTKVYPLAKASNPPAMEFLNGSGKAINTVAPDTFAFFEMLAQLVNEEPAEVFTPLERFYMQAIGIERQTLQSVTERQGIARRRRAGGAAMARANSFCFN